MNVNSEILSNWYLLCVCDVQTLRGEKVEKKRSFCPSGATILAREINQTVVHQSMMGCGDEQSREGEVECRKVGAVCPSL